MQLAAFRIEAHQPAGGRIALATGIHQHFELAVQLRGNGRRVTRAPSVLHLPNQLAALQIKRRHAHASLREARFALPHAQRIIQRSFFAAHVQNHASIENQRRSARAEEILRHMHFRPQIVFPQQLACFQLQRAQFARHAIRHHHAIGDHRAPARPGSESIAILIRNRVFMLPEALPRLAMQALDRLQAFQRVKNHAVVTADRR